MHKGLDGVVVDESRICWVDGDEGKIWYAGYDLDDLVGEASYEELLYLLFHDELPSESELREVEDAMARRRELPDAVAEAVDGMVDAGPMHVMRTAVSMLAAADDDPDELEGDAVWEKSLGVAAKMPTVLARQHRGRRNERAVEPDVDLGHAENFLYMLHGERPSEEETRAMDDTLVLYAEHGMNASTFSAVVTASTLASVYSSLTSAVGTLQGPLHGGATETVVEMLDDVGSPDAVESWVDGKMDAGERIPGFGHRVYSVADPRCKHFSRHIDALADGEARTWYETAEALRDEVEARLGDKGIYPNTDLYSGTLYRILGVPPAFYTALFACSRVAGWSAHVDEQLEDNRIMRPRVEFVGELGREYVSVGER
ncbi:MAG: citrate/2-methylcitrate synthase [Halobacteriales archaeon]